jgi:WD40 repeat protein
VYSLRFHPDGKSIICSQGSSTSEEFGVTRLDILSGNVILGLTNVTQRFDLDRNGNLAIDRMLNGYEIWDLDAPVELATLETGTVAGEASGAVFSKTGDVLAVADADKIYLWDVPTGKLKQTLLGHNHHVRSMALSPDGRTLFSSAFVSRFETRDKGPPAGDDVRIWDIQTGAALGGIPINEAYVPAIALSPDGAMLATVFLRFDKNGPQATLSLWDVKTRTLRATLEENRRFEYAFGPFVSAVYRPNGTLVIAAGREISVWDVAGRKLSKRIKLTQGVFLELISLAISPDGKHCAVIVVDVLSTAGIEPELQFWDVDSGVMNRKLPKKSAAVFSPDGKTVVSQGAKSIDFINVETGQARGGVDGYSLLSAPEFAFSPDGLILASAKSIPGRAGNPAGPRLEVKFWDLGPPQLQLIPTFSANILGAQLFSERNSAITYASDVTWCWDLEPLRLRCTIRHQEVSATGRAVSPDASTMATWAAGSADIQIWDMKTGARLAQFRAPQGPIQLITFAPDAKTLSLVNVKKGSSSEVTIWSLNDDRATASFLVPDMSVVRLAFSPDGNILAFIARDGTTIVLRDLKSASQLPPLKSQQVNRTMFLPQLRFTRDSQRVIKENLVQGKVQAREMWDWRAGKVVDEPVPAVDARSNRYELNSAAEGMWLIDHGWKPPNVVSQRRKPGQ